ncbi:GNAT family N-acetyltransferase [Cecembia lonarensis]|uniref:Putative acetyltransferase n=1 Tax=Cecembia lonarensis (strain CCUG 58316 / KCTC 22772 / LW9) TaxID=1225176 RepID=K1LFC3_CECL9|nr:GNAT family N-acetyltransferase [Cecembia lonarensis]EKB50902.1 putative acetyltransferase [Cecembia lonarensis LW9]
MIRITQANLSELQKVREIALKTWPQTFANILTQEQIDYMLEWMYQLEALEQQVLEKGHVFLLANEGEKSLGFCAYELHAKDSSKTKIHKIYILPETQGKGVGKKLIQEVAQTAQKNGDTHLFLNVNKYNQTAIDFYSKIGFYEDFREVIDIGNGFVMDDVVMEMKIT